MTSSDRVLISRLAYPLFWGAVVVLGYGLLSTSWMRWMDPQIDFGREVYLPWQILEGRHLGRDFVHPYGPLSDYFNAGLFAVFGVSIRTLVIANLAVFIAIVFFLHRVLRRGFGFCAASVAVLVTITVFGFGHYVGVGNYNYAAPYAHEATHGMLLLLILMSGLQVRASRRYGGWAVGVLTGLVFLTKIEFVFAAMILWGFVAIMDARLSTDIRAEGKKWWLQAAGGWALLMLASILIFAIVVGWRTGIKLTFSAALSPVFYPAYTKATVVLGFLGIDNASLNFLTILRVGFITVGAVGVISALMLVAGKMKPGPRYTILAGVGAGVVFAAFKISWIGCGWAFPGLLVGIAVLVLWRNREHLKGRTPMRSKEWAQVLFWIAAAGMLGRMALAPKIYHFGFFQAILAGAGLVAFFVDVWPKQITRHMQTQRVAGSLAAGFFIIGSVLLLQISLRTYGLKIQPVGEGGDKIYGFRAEVNPAANAMEQARVFFAKKQLPPSTTLTVVPDGILLNYQLRLRSPLMLTDLLPDTIHINPQDIMIDLRATQPDYLLAISRDVRELGVPYFGATDYGGKAIAQWIDENYVQEAGIGGTPFNPNSFGLWIMKRKSSGEHATPDAVR